MRLNSPRLAAKRRSRNRRILILFAVLVALALGSILWGLQSSKIRVATITSAYGVGEPVADIARREMLGSYLGIIPRDSIFFVPEHAIRVAILNAHPEIQAVSISGDGLTSISIKVDERVAVGKWCGLKKTPDVPEYCYFFDVDGLIYQAVDVASSTKPLNPFAFYDALAASSTEPLRALLKDAPKIPAMFDFARQMRTLGANVESVTVHNDEVTDTFSGGTYLLYVLGQEQNAFAALTSAKSSFNLSNGSVLYVDLRFPGKVYVKHSSAPPTQ